MQYIKHLLKRCSKKILSAFLACCLSGVSVFAQTGSDTLVKTQITTLNEQMEEAFNANNMTKVATFYADDAEIIYDDGYTVKGRTNLDKYWISLKDKGRGWKLTVVEIGGRGEFVYQLGQSDLKHISRDKETRSVTNFVLLWRKQADGSYKIFRDYLTKTGFVKK